MNINPQEILNALLPRGGFELIYDIFLYIMFFMNLVLMFAQSDKQIVPTIFAGGAAALAVIAKLNVFAPKEFGSLIVNAGIMILPFLVFGITNAKKTRPIAMISGILGAVYFFMFWFFSQNVR